MEAIISNSSFDYIQAKFVSVIASFDTDGNIAPLYVRIGAESYKVSSYIRNKRLANTVDFNCKIVDDNFLKPLMLTYYQKESVWLIAGQK